MGISQIEGKDSNGDYAILVWVQMFLITTNLRELLTRIMRSSVGVAVIGASAILALNGCAPSATEGGFSNPSPGARIYAVQDAVKFNRREQIPQIVECLCADDDLLRYLSIAALQRMTGQDLGYQFDDPEPLRFVAYERWRQWTIDQKLAPPEQAYASTIYPPSRPRPQW